MIDLSARNLIAEKMDDLHASEPEVIQALRELEVINKFLGGQAVILNALNRLKLPDRELRIVDLACGGGDLLRSVATWAQKKNRKVHLTGIDRNPLMTEYASKRSRHFPNINYMTLDVFDSSVENIKPDLITCSLFCHHLDNEQLTSLLKRMQQIASEGIIINDLHRHWFPYYSIKILTALFSKTDMVKYDAPVSVGRSLTHKEWNHILHSAGISKFNLRWMWAWRWQVIIKK